jgi:chromosome partitioning protein
MKHRLIAVAGPKGGSGKSTIATHLAVYYSQTTGPTMAVDMDNSSRSMTNWCARRSALLDAGQLPSALTTIHAAIAPQGGAGFKMALALLDHYTVVLDLAGMSGAELTLALRVADTVVVPVRPTAFDVWATSLLPQAMREAHDLREAASLPPMDLRVVLTQAPPQQARLVDDAAHVLRASGLPVARTRIGTRAAFGSAGNSGISVVEAPVVAAAGRSDAKIVTVRPDPKAIAEITALCEEITDVRIENCATAN